MIPLNDSSLEALNSLSTKHQPYLFINTRTGNRLTTIGKTWDRLRKEAGFPKLKLHQLRHSFASYLLNSGEDIMIVSRILGHADITTITRYLHASPHSLIIASSRASEVITKAMHHD